VQQHTKIYLTVFGYDTADNTVFVPSEISGDKGIDVHHIVTREDKIENLMMLTRSEHDAYGEIKYVMALLLKIHRRVLQLNNIPFDESWFSFYISKYQNLSEREN